MRAIALLGTLGLLLAAAPALAHEVEEGGHGLLLTQLVMTFDPLTQSLVYSFDVANDPTGATGSLWARVTLLDGDAPQRDDRVSSAGLASGASGHFDLSLSRAVAAKSCIFVYATATGVDKASNWACAQTSGVAQSPTPLPVELPSAHEIEEIL